MKGTYDDVHFNYWEEWFQEAYEVSEFNSGNTLWMTYFITGHPITVDDQKFLFKKILQTVYTSLPDIIGVLFLQRGDADEEDIEYCFAPIREIFEEV